MIEPSKSLALFHPLIAGWFEGTLGAPTAVQAEAWPVIARGDHVLVTAPTGSGKTLTAFLWALDRLATGDWPGGRTRVLYVSPLKALNTDIRRNLLEPLAGLESVFRKACRPFPAIRVETRSGDTPQAERRQMLRRPPEILITTPESLNILLSSRSGRGILDSLRTVIIDEIHTVVGDKRGVHLITAVDRLVPLSGEFQRIAISATIKPLATVAEFVGGLRLEPGPAGPRFVPRPVTIVRSGEGKRYDLRVIRPEDGADGGAGETRWVPLVREFRRIIDRNRSSLFFARSRRMCEHLTLRINEGEESPVAYAHHGSLARELRLEVEGKLKAGDLKAIVATNSLELGIDIGALDEVVLVQSPPSIASGVQRIGRAGHRVGAVSRGTFVPTHDEDIVESAVIAAAVEAGDIETVRPVENALDVLAQVLLSMTGVEVRKVDELYDRIRTSWPFRRLSREHFDLVLRMLSGRYAHTRIRELRPRISLDAIDGTAAARKEALIDLFISGGTIPDRGYFHLRHEESGALIGELDEEFVWEASVGQAMTFGTQHWTIRRITHNEVFVSPAGSRDAPAPFWKGEVFNRNAHLSDRIAAFLEEADARLDDPAWFAELGTRHHLDGGAARRLVDHLKRQKQKTGVALPHLGHIVAEHVRTGPDGYPGSQVVLHTLWGGRLNRPFALALDAAWEERYGYRPETYAGDDVVILQLPHQVPADDLLSLVGPANLEPLLRKRLESSGYFGARFRENAGRALLITRRRFNERMPLWMSRLRSQKLLQAVMRMPDFPILLETWRTCLRDEFDLEALQAKLTALAAGATRVSECTTPRPSPMAASLAWKQVNQYMYTADELPADRRSALKSELLRELVFTPGLRPSVSADTVRGFEDKRQRLSPGYAPPPDRELVDWLKERVVLAWPEWERLLDAVKRDHAESAESERGGEAAEGGHGTEGEAADEARGPAAGASGAGVFDLPAHVLSRLVRMRVPGTGHDFVCALERAPEILTGFGWTGRAELESPAGGPLDVRSRAFALRSSRTARAEEEARFTSLLGEWLQFFGPLTATEIERRLGLGPGRIESGLEDLRDAEALIEGALVRGVGARQVCNPDNFEILLRMERRAASPHVETRRLAELPLFLARVQGLVPPAAARSETGEEKTLRAAEQLIGYALPAPLWEAEVLPARIHEYSVSLLDFALHQSDLRWRGDSEGHVRFLFASDMSLVEPESGAGGRNGRRARDDARPEARSPDPARKPEHAKPGDAGALFRDPAARYDFASLLRRSGDHVGRLEEKLWRQVWAGRLTNDTWSAVRRGLQTDFRVAEVIDHQKRSLEFAARRGGLHLAAWRESQAYPGSWFLLPEPAPPGAAGDLIEQEERRKDRVRILLDRYGLVFRELLVREQPPFRWSDVFRTLRIMELSGEVLAGYFFDGIPGPQFMSQQAFRLFLRKPPADAVFWMSAVDPASVCGLGFEGLRDGFPKRVEGAHLVFHGTRLVLVSQRKGRSLTIAAGPDEAGLGDYFGVLRHLLTRDFDPLSRIVIERINDEPAPASPYLPALRRVFEVVRDRSRVSLFRTLEG